MGLRKAASYSKKRIRTYTRKSAKRKKAYVKAIPAIKIVKYNMGNKAAHVAGKHNYVVSMLADEKAQMRDNALESCRMIINKSLEKEAPGEFYFEIKVYPHNILRENKTAAGAGADRLSSGMKHSFGITVGRSAIVSKGKEIFCVFCANEKVAQIAKKTLIKAKPKVPFKNKIVFNKVK